MTKSKLALGTMLSMVLLQGGSPAARAQDNQSASVTGLENIVVTARRREETSQTTPVSVTAMTSERLERLNIRQTSDLNGLVAGLVTQPQSSFDGGFTAFIRGIGSTDTLQSVDQPVATYRDGVYIGRTSLAGNIDQNTLARVEVLRGPQGTLFGRNTTGGAINFVTRDPSQDFHVAQGFRFGSFKEFQSTTTIDTGEIGSTGITALATYKHRKRNGFTNDPTLPKDKWPGNLNEDSIFAKVRGEWGNFKLTYTFDLDDVHAMTAPLQLTAVAPVVAAYYANSVAVGGAPLQFSPNRLGTQDLTDVPQHHVRMWGHALNAELKLADALTVKSISAWRNFNMPFLDIGVGDANTRGPSGAVQPIGVIGPKNSYGDQFSQEVQLLGDIGEFSYVGGFFYLEETGYDRNTGTYTFVVSPTVAVQAPSTTEYTVANDSRAFFGQLSYKPHFLEDKAELTGGVRYTDDHKQAFQTQRVVRSGDQRFKNTTYSVSLKYQWTPDIMTFGRIGTGIRAGGFNLRAGTGQEFVFRPERATSYELGLKSQFFDNRVRANLGAFYTKYRDLQLNTISAGTGGSGAVGGIGGNTFNANANFRGFEVELQVVPFQGLTVSGNLGYVDPKYEQFFIINPATGLPQNYASTSHFNYVPKTNASLDATYTYPTDIGTFVASLTMTYVSKRWFAPNLILAPLNDVIAANPYTVFNGRIALADVKLGSSTGEIAFWMDNITNRLYRQSGIDFGTLNFGTNTYATPRTLGVDIKITY